MKTEQQNKMKCICKETHWNDFFKNETYYYYISGWHKDFFIVENKNKTLNNHSFNIFLFNQHFITEKELRKQKLKKLNER